MAFPRMKPLDHNASFSNRWTLGEEWGISLSNSWAMHSHGKWEKHQNLGNIAKAWLHILLTRKFHG